MQATEPSPFVSPFLQNAVETGVDNESAITTDDSVAEDTRAFWQSVIDHKLIEWGRDPNQFDEEGVDPPTPETVGRAIELAQLFGQLRLAAASRVVPDPYGGIVFEREEGNVLETMRICDDGSLQHNSFDKSKVMRYEIRRVDGE